MRPDRVCVSRRWRGYVSIRSHPPLPRWILPRTAPRHRSPLRATVATLLTGALGLAALAGGGAAAAVPVATASAQSGGTSGGTDWTKLVDPFVSTAGDDGNDLPGAEAPHSLAKVNPLTTPNRNHPGYDYNEDHIAGFTATNLDGVGGSGGGGDLLVVPTSVQYDSRPASGTYAHAYSHDDETATPGYYQVGLGAISGTGSSVKQDPGTIKAEMTATTRTALERYSFPAGSDPKLVLDLANNFTSRTHSTMKATKLPNGNTSISGLIAGSFNGASYQMYYNATTNVPVTSLKSWGNDGKLGDATSQDGTDTGAVLGFDKSAGDNIELRITLSPISAEQAAIDQQNEVGKLTFDQARARTKADWNSTLGAVAVKASAKSDPGSTLTKEFYTHLYRMYASPVNATSTSGTYRGVDGAVHKTNGFTYYDGWSTWDDFRKYSVEAYIDPATYRDMIQSLVELFADANASGKSLGSLTHSVPTVRWERSAVLVADALSKGYKNFDRLDEAYPALLSYSGYYTGAQLRQGYVAGDPGTTVQRGYDQWALAIIADSLGKKDDAKKLRTQATMAIDNLVKSGAWTAADGTKVGLLTPRAAGGDWQSADYEKFEAAGLYQGTLWQYHWYDAYDMGGLIKAMGGDKAGKAAVEHMFGEDSTVDDGSTMLHSNANEIDLQAPYLFNYVGEPSLTQKWVRAIYTGTTWNRYIATGSTNEAPSSGGEFTPPVKTQVYKLAPDGFLPTMDNDAGTMSTMFVAAALGLFPVTAGSSEFQIGSPFFDSTTITYANGNQFTVKADGVSASNYYVQNATLNGKRFNNTWLDYSQIISGGTLDFTMGSKPSQWGANTEPAYSLNTDKGDSGDGGTGPGKGDTVVSARPSSVDTASDGTVDDSVKLTLDGPASFAARNGTSLTKTGAATVTGLPGGVKADLRVSGSRTATLSLTGTTKVDARFGITFSDSAFGHGTRASTVSGTGISATDPLVISAAAVQRKSLGALVDQASLVRGGNYSDGSWTLFRSALERARTVLADTTSATGTIMAAEDALRSAIDALAIDEGGYAVLQAETPDQKEGPSLVSEAYYSDGDLGGVTEGSWVRYNKTDFGGVAPRSVSVRYANSQATNAKPSSVDIHAGAADGPVVATVSLPGTGGWQYYSTVQAAVTDPDALLGASSATFVFHAPSGQQWVSNFDWFQFSPYEVSTSPSTTLATLSAANSTTTGGGSLPLNLSNGIFENTTNGAWAQWKDTDLRDGADTVTVRYDKPQSRAASDSHIELHLGSKDGPKSVDIPLDYSGSGWGTIATTSVRLDPSVFTGVQDVYADFVSSTQTADQPYVANVYSLTLTQDADAPVGFDATAFKSNSGGGLKSEPVGWTGAGSTTDLGGTYDGAWLDYGDIDFGRSPKSTVTVTYANNSARCGTGSAVQLYLDSFDAASPGTPYATIPLPVTGSAWSSGGTTSLTLPKEITGTHAVHLRLTTNPDSAHPYVANLGRITFDHVEAPVVTDKAALLKAIEQYEGLSGDAERYNAIDFGVYTRELGAARDLVAADNATQLEVDTQTRRLTLAAKQLIPVPRLRLEDLVTTASALDNTRYTDASWKAFTKALGEAKTTVADTKATDKTLTARYTTLDHAMSALKTKPKTVPTAPDAVSATSSGTSVTVAWSAPKDDGGSPVTGYKVSLSDGHEITIHDPNSRSTTFTWLRSGRSYMARVQAVNTFGVSHQSAATAPVVTGGGKPQKPTVTSVITHGKQVRVTWRAAGDGGFPIIGYIVVLDDGTTAHVPGTVNTALLTTRSKAKTHTATVTAITLAGTSDDSRAAASATAAATVSATAADPAYEPSPFPDDTLNASYASDKWPGAGDGTDYFNDLLNGFDDLGSGILGANTKVPHGAALTAENDQIAVRINNAATQKEVDRAEVDAANSATVTMADGLGSRLGQIYSDALNGGRLPKTSALFSRVTKNLDKVDAAKNDYGYLRPYVRLGFVGDGGDIYESQDGSYSSLATSGSYPSGHTYGGYEAGTILATLLPELAPSILARTSEYGDNRIVLGFHYPLDVMGGRITGQATVAHRWADPDFAKLLTQAHTEMENVLLAQCEKEGYGDTLAACEGDSYGGLSTAQDVDLYTRRLTYGFSQVGKSGQALKTPSDAAALLITAFPDLTTEQRTQILEQTATDSGYPLDLTADGGASWGRINLAAAMAAKVVVNADGSVTVKNFSDATKAGVADARAITVGGVAIDGFDPEVSTYVVDWPKNKRIPAVSATPAQSGARVKVTDGSSVLSSTGSRFTTRTIKVTSANGSVTRTYTVGFQLTDRDDRPVAAGGNGRDGGDAALAGSGLWPSSGLFGIGGIGAPLAGGAGFRSPVPAWTEPR
ncbi:glycoside hydrolase domain-containing protein [Streptomyces sp. AK02-01A]|uniref:glycoside hydrolase domain-containing protein n=1 Tax=Streptomyces sp. AK02-01A TaxID=3028648 RepID=UPI0029A8AD92|nr:glycoside hydrolase domain-containing protein [Streptomyces sp. AK02-01A]MDX3850243.1 glycoside hydrolase family 92 protein [Streptomyces sp. AK02-01A]